MRQSKITSFKEDSMAISGSRFLIDHSVLTKRQLSGLRAALIIGGLAAVLLGILIWSWPNATLLLVGWAFGVFFIISGIVRAVIGLSARWTSAGSKTLTVVLSVLLVIAGIVVLANPGFGIVVLATLVGIVWILEGIAALTSIPDGSLKWLAVIYGVLSILGGILVVLAPVAAAGLMLIFAASLLIVAGIMQTLEGIVFGRGQDRPTVV
ncbi:Uncharacterized membrane protein HdeD, DUF308 family [Paramicrobacterium humi]|uniref:Uncharacterized membrane protein HdeD, DUF308 family n=1 Tax=Paramicrobacterium humi TaxID=640635 RepID=A0A1H4R631_9MICO|nr:DUF308 domain-containing protein [Microbacterium humi]SEC27352.1 Uncharacterized membrane protein HdeD, DUF308 family [Microbacterium humi]